MPLYANAAEKFFMKTLNLAPAPISDITAGLSFFAVDAALRLNIFEFLKKNGMSAEKLSLETGCDHRGLEIFLEVLESLGYLKRKKDQFYITRMTRKWMLNSSQNKFQSGFPYYAMTMREIWPHLAESLRKGDAHINFYDWLNNYPETAKQYQTYMIGLAELMLPELVKKIKLKGNRILDIGGSHGLYSIALCRKFPDISVTIIDSPYALPLLKKNIKEAKLENRISFIQGDFKEYSFSTKYDTILLFNVLHEHKEDYNLELIKKIHGTLEPGGAMIILDGMREKKSSPMLSFAERIYSLMFFHFLGGQNYRFTEIKGWMDKTGFSGIKRKELHKSGFTLITGLK
jgi:2-polyprenyl-3-methyl-5-hydroxy-6-metoxy-1,4-benzoquinol methylase